MPALLPLWFCACGMIAAGSHGRSDGGIDGGGDAAAGVTSVRDLVSETLFEELFLHRASEPCQGGFYTYQALVAAAETFPAFAGQGSVETRKRELAAFLANIAHETTGGWPAAPDGPYSWGLCWIREGATIDPSQLPEYCAPSAEWPCQPGKKYFGRGPMQLSWNYNYGQAGRALGADLLADPDLVTAEAALAFRTALWFWMTPQPPKPSAHDVMAGGWTPSPEDQAAGRVPGFGMTINIINGGLECNQPTTPQVEDRIGYYMRFTTILAVTPGESLTCENMQSY